MGLDGRYIYGFVSTNEVQSLGPIGIEGEDVYTFPFKEIAAVVSHLPASGFDSLPKETLLRNLIVYQLVIERVMTQQQIIPVKFGTLLDGDKAVRTILESGYHEIQAGLRGMDDRIELDVVALWPDLDTVLAQIGEEAEIKALKGEAVSRPADEIVGFQIMVGKRVKELLDQKKEESKTEIMNALVETAEEHVLHPLMDDTMIMNVAFLIQKEKEGQLEEQVARLDRQYEETVNFRIIGPLPPYSFRTLEIRKADYERLNEARKTLELGEETTSQEIRDAYWQLTKKYHPDKSPGDRNAQKLYEKINQAYRLVNEYCDENLCSFRECDVKKRIVVRQVERIGRPESGMQ